MGDAELGRNSRAVAVVPVEQLDDGTRLPELAGAGERRLMADGVDEPDASAGGERVGRPRRRFVDDPREPGRTSVVAELDLHDEKVRGPARRGPG